MMPINQKIRHSTAPLPLSFEHISPAQKEAFDIAQKGYRNFLFTPTSQGGIINGIPTFYKKFSTLLHLYCEQKEQSFIFSLKDPQDLIVFINDLLHKTPYENPFIKHSIRKINSNDLPYRFNGGSFADVHLFLHKNKTWKVAKIINNTSRDLDAEIRLLEEARFIHNLPTKAGRFFAKVEKKDIISTTQKVGYYMNYCPFPTMAELVLSNTITPQQAVTLLSSIYEKMFTYVYPLKKSASHQEDNYFQRIARRNERIFATPNNIGKDLKRLLKANNLIIDGEQYLGFFPLYKIICNTPSLARLVIPPLRSVCHGDMILEDIIINPYTSKFTLVDPNGSSDSYYYDIAKTLLSLGTYYELLHADRFILQYETKNIPAVNIIFKDKALITYYDTMNNLFWEYLIQNERGFFPGNKAWRQQLILLNGLQNIAIIMFHLIRHNNEKRAIAFLLMGIKKLTAFLDAIQEIPS